MDQAARIRPCGGSPRHGVPIRRARRLARAGRTCQIAHMTRQEAETLAKVEVLADLEEVVHQLMITHEAKRVLWFPSELLAPEPDTDPDHHLRELRERSSGISLPARVALALNLLTEEGLPHFHRLLGTYLWGAPLWGQWTNLRNGADERHGA